MSGQVLFSAENSVFPSSCCDVFVDRLNVVFYSLDFLLLFSCFLNMCAPHSISFYIFPHILSFRDLCPQLKLLAVYFFA